MCGLSDEWRRLYRSIWLYLSSETSILNSTPPPRISDPKVRQHVRRANRKQALHSNQHPLTSHYTTPKTSNTYTPRLQALYFRSHARNLTQLSHQVLHDSDRMFLLRDALGERGLDSSDECVTDAGHDCVSKGEVARIRVRGTYVAVSSVRRTRGVYGAYPKLGRILVSAQAQGEG